MTNLPSTSHKLNFTNDDLSFSCASIQIVINDDLSLNILPRITFPSLSHQFKYFSNYDLSFSFLLLHINLNILPRMTFPSTSHQFKYFSNDDLSISFTSILIFYQWPPLNFIHTNLYILSRTTFPSHLHQYFNIFPMPTIAPHICTAIKNNNKLLDFPPFRIRRENYYILYHMHRISTVQHLHPGVQMCCSNVFSNLPPPSVLFVHSIPQPHVLLSSLTCLILISF
jgi:hypothetical protein